MPDAYRCPYTPVRNRHGDLVLRPLLPLSLSHRGRTISTTGLLDTGADVNVLPYAVGVQAGADWDAQPPVPRLSGNLAATEVRGIVLTAVVGHFAPVRLAFAWVRAEDVPLVLGNLNFLAEFDVCFFRSRGTFELRPKHTERAPKVILPTARP
jgi:hypothetical protein